MTQQDDGLALLPSGFEDVLPPFAESEAKSIRVLTDKFLSFGYQLVKPPLLEFEDSLLAPGPGERLASETFRLMDPVSHRMLGVRSDITAQIARIVSSRLESSTRPLRLTYANDVLRTRGHQMRTQRQFTQVGCELIGGDLGLEGDVEICVLAILGLKSSGIDDITIDFTVPGFLRDLSENSLKAAEQRDVSVLRQNGEAQLADIIDAYGDSNAILKLIADDDLSALFSAVKIALDDLGIDDVNISVDPLEQHGFEYHRSFGFTLFSKSVSGELGRGGAYDAAFAKDGDSPAKGFTLYMDTISKILKSKDFQDVVEVSTSASWSEVLEIQKQGKRIVRV